jgi:hypothetical protein
MEDRRTSISSTDSVSYNPIEIPHNRELYTDNLLVSSEGLEIPEGPLIQHPIISTNPYLLDNEDGLSLADGVSLADDLSLADELSISSEALEIPEGTLLSRNDIQMTHFTDEISSNPTFTSPEPNIVVEEKVEIEELVYNDITFHVDTNNRNIYNIETGDVIGIWKDDESNGEPILYNTNVDGKKLEVDSLENPINCRADEYQTMEKCREHGEHCQWMGGKFNRCQKKKGKSTKPYKKRQTKPVLLPQPVVEDSGIILGESTELPENPINCRADEYQTMGKCREHGEHCQWMGGKFNRCQKKKSKSTKPYKKRKPKTLEP